MKKMTVNNELTLSYNEPFTIMTAGELTKYCGTAKNHWGIADKASHSLFIVSWTKPGLLNFFTDAKTILNQIERSMKRNLRQYDREDSFIISVAGKDARGIRFTYAANDVNVMQIGETSVFRANKKFYVIQYVSRVEGDAHNRGVYHDILKTLSLTA